MIDFVKRKKYWFIGFLLVIGLSTFLYVKYSGKNSTTQYTTTAVEKQTIISSISASGSISSSNFSSVKTSSSGIVSNVFIKDGDMVQKGQKLVQITLDSDGQQNYNEAYAALLAAQTNYNNAVNNKLVLENNVAQAQSTIDQQRINTEKALNSAKAGLVQAQSDRNHASGTKEIKLTKIALDSAKKTLEVAQMQYDALGSSSDQNQTNAIVAQNKLDESDSATRQAQTNLDSAKLDLEGSSPIVYAPITGLVSGLNIFEGMAIASTSTTSSSNSGASSSSSSTQLLSISNQSNPLVTVNVTESDINKIKVDQKASIALDALSDKTFTGKVVGIDKIGSVSSNVTNYPITIQFDTQSDEVLPNMSATVDIILDSKTDVLSVVTAAIGGSETDGYTVNVLVNGKIEAKTVTIGINSDSQTEIKTGLNVGDLVITGTTSSTSSTKKSSSSSTSSVFGGITTGGTSSLGSSGNARTQQNFGPPN